MDLSIGCIEKFLICVAGDLAMVEDMLDTRLASVLLNAHILLHDLQ